MRINLFLMVICKEVVLCGLTRRGDGKSPSTPVRAITEVYDKDGTLIAEKDPCGGFNIEDLADLAGFISKGSGDLDAWLRLRGKWASLNP